MSNRNKMELSRREFIESSAKMFALTTLPTNKNLIFQGDVSTQDKLEATHTLILEREKHQKQRRSYLQDNSPSSFDEREPEWAYNYYCTKRGTELSRGSLVDTIKFKNLYKQPFTYFQAEANILYLPNSDIERVMGISIYEFNSDKIKRKETHFQSFLDTPISKEPYFPEKVWEVSDLRIDIWIKDKIPSSLLSKHKSTLRTIHESIVKDSIRYREPEFLF
jgi:hypothetical protein